MDCRVEPGNDAAIGKRRVGKANGSRECAPDDRLRVPTIASNTGSLDHGGHGASAPLPYGGCRNVFTIC